jgi:hypothetical protein
MRKLMLATLAVAVTGLTAVGESQGLPTEGKRRFVVTVTTDRSLYFGGDTVGVTAMAVYTDGQPVLQLRRSRVELRDVGGQLAYSGSLASQGGGSYTAACPLAASPPSGEWVVAVTMRDVSGYEARASARIQVRNCPDADLDGHRSATCGGDDCDDSDPSVYPGATEVCGDGIDQDCSGADLACGGGDPHASLTWNGPGTCLTCHPDEAHDVHSSVMYQWQGPAPFMVSGPPVQGKIAGAVNSYCVNILGNWGACGSCHLGLGALPEAEATPQQLANIDCLLCHQQGYKRRKVNGVFVPDTAAMTITMDEAVQTVHRPVRANCLQCHAKAGGGDALKRGDITLAHAATTDREFDVHMATTGADLACQECHTFTNHHVSGRGSDLRVTDSNVPLECSRCHASMASNGHGSSIQRHVARVACQVCHIPVYAKDASDTAATEATETFRTWLDTHATAPPFHPANIKANDLQPVYRFWNRYNRNYLLYDQAMLDPATGRYPTSRPIGDVADPASKLYAFKYKTAEQPMTNVSQQLIALDTSVFFATADPAAAVEAGLVNMGLPAHEPYSWVETDTFQMLNHEVSTHEQALDCNECHGTTARMDLQGELGYALKGPRETVCFQCHGPKESKPFQELHNKHVTDKRYDCSWCHTFSRPERGLTMPRT